jgi:hypothetical protein
MIDVTRKRGGKEITKESETLYRSTAKCLSLGIQSLLYRSNHDRCTSVEAIFDEFSDEY